jgi:hypothetical protein
MHHLGDRRIDPFHRRARPRRAIGASVRELPADWPDRAKRPQPIHHVRPFERCEALDDRAPAGVGMAIGTDRRAPFPLGHQFARQAEGQIEGADPGAIGLQPAIERLEAPESLERMHPDRLERITGLASRCRCRTGHHDALWPGAARW